MKSVDTGKEKVKKICEVLKRETLEPAKKEGEEIIVKARAEAEKIVADAKRESERIHKEAKEKIEEERNVFEASINLAAKKSLDTLKQEIEKELFNPELSRLVGEKMGDPKVVGALISAIIAGIEKEGIDGDLRALVSSTLDKEAAAKELAKGALDRLGSKALDIGEIEGGAQVKILEKNLTIDLSGDALKTLIAGFVREDFRSVIFAADV